MKTRLFPLPLATVLFAGAVLGGCSIAAPAFNWYHPMGGEHLFAFDADQCREQSRAQGASMTSNPESPFFRCMHQRGYSLVDEQGNLLEPVAATAAIGPRVTQQ